MALSHFFSYTVERFPQIVECIIRLYVTYRTLAKSRATVIDTTKRTTVRRCGARLFAKVLAY